MRTRLRLTLAAVLAGAPACLPYAIPPGQAEFGFARDARWGQGTMVHLGAGIHSASVPQLIAKPIDLGVGYGADLDSGCAHLCDRQGVGGAVWGNY